MDSPKALLKRFLLSFVILSFLSLIGLGGYYYWQGTPQYSLYQMAKAIKNHNSKSFLLYLDIDQIVDGLADSTFKEVEKKTSPTTSSEKGKKHNSPSINAKDAVKNLMPQVIKALKPILKKQLIKVVEDIGQERTVSPLAFCVLSKMKKGSHFAEVVINIKKNQTYAFTMARQPNRLWKVVRINIDLLDILQKAQKMEK